MRDRGDTLLKKRGDPLHSDIPEWLQEFMEILVRMLFRVDNVHTHFPTDRNCEICQRTKSHGSCAVDALVEPHFVQKKGDLTTADHKVLSDNCESRNNHRYAVVVQDLATQWIQSYPCKTKTSQEPQWSLQKFLEPEGKPKVIHTDNSFKNLAKPVKIFPGIVARLHHIDRRLMLLRKEQCAE